MKYKIKYSIGDVSDLCNISKKALRYYDNIGLIPTQRKDYNNYRYYTYDSLLAVPIIKYYKQMGFTLDEMREFIEGNTTNIYRAMRASFSAKISELEKVQEDIHRQHSSVKDWYDLVMEAEMVIDNDIRDVSIKYVEPCEVLFQEQEYDNNIRSTVINIDFTNYVENQGNQVIGPVILNFSSFKERMADTPQPIRVLQRTLLPCTDAVKMKFGGHMMVSCYHIGPHESLGETYTKMCKWVRKHGYCLGEESFERYVTDYWTTRNSALFVTEVMMKVSRQGAGKAEYVG